MTVITNPAEAQAIGLCWLARQRGLPEIHSLRQAVTQLHAEPCGWCVYPPDYLIGLLEQANDGTVSESAEKHWWQMHGKARLKAIEHAQGKEAL